MNFSYMGLFWELLFKNCFIMDSFHREKNLFMNTLLPYGPPMISLILIAGLTQEVLPSMGCSFGQAPVPVWIPPGCSFLQDIAWCSRDLHVLQENFYHGV